MPAKKGQASKSLDDSSHSNEESKHNLPWGEEMEVTLLKQVKHHMAHMPVGMKDLKPSADRWRDACNGFFNESKGGLPYKDTHFKFDEKGKPYYRNLKEKYDKLLCNITHDMAKGNQSGKEGDLSEKYKLVKEINREIDGGEEIVAAVKIEGEKDKNKLENNARAILNGTKKRANTNSAVKIKQLDGTIEVNESRAVKKAFSKNNTLDSKLFQLIDLQMKAANREAEQAELAAVTTKNISHFIRYHGHDLRSFLAESIDSY